MRIGRRIGGLTAAIVASGSALLAACEEAPPRGFIEYMEDAVAREATLVRCNQDRPGTALDVECANARRAAAAVAAREDHARRSALEEQSDRKRAELRAQIAAQQAAQRAAQEAAEQAARAAYEAQWGALPDGTEITVTTEVVVPPTMLQADRTQATDVQAADGAVALETTPAAAPAQTMPRPFRDGSATTP
jgi:hypothetical protein